MKNKVLVYDDNCPLCTWYSGLFVKLGLLDPDGRRPFSTIDGLILSRIDFNKSRNEIPLVDIQTGQTWYGIDALLEILGNKLKLVKTIGHLPPVNWLLRKLYKFISYNRKVIVAKKCSEGAIDCAPDINYFHRVLFILLFLGFTTLMLCPLHNLVLSRLSFYNPGLAGLQTVHFGFVIINCMLCTTLTKAKALEYMGQANMLAVTGILLSIPLMLLSCYFIVSEKIVIAYLSLIAIIIFREYLRRMDYAGILKSNQWIAGINLFCMAAFVFILFS